MARDPVSVETLLTPEEVREFDQAIRQNDVETFKRFFESSDRPMMPDDEIQDVPLLFYAMDASRWRGEDFASPDIIMYLVSKGANVNYYSLGTLASNYSSQFWPGDADDDPIEVYTTPAMNAAVKGDLELLQFLYEQGAQLEFLAFDQEDQPVPGENALYFAEKRMLELDRDIEGSMRLEALFQRNPRLTNAQKAQYTDEEKARLNQHTKDRIKVARVIKWLRGITIQGNIPSAVLQKQYNAFRNVLRQRAPLANLEQNEFSKFLSKPAKFKIQPTNIGLKHVNTTLFQGGKKSKRRTKKKRNTHRKH